MTTGRGSMVALWIPLLIASGSAVPAASMVRQEPQLGDPLPGLTADQFARFVAGLVVFSREFTPADGLGPLFNNRSCAACHESPVIGGVGEFEEDDVDMERHVTAGDQPYCDELEAAGGPVFRQLTTDAALFPLPAIPADFEVHVAMRSTPMLFGFGLVEAIPESAIVANEGKAGGRAALIADGRIGRFGRKATDPDLAGFVTGAFDKEQGVDVPGELSEAERDLAVDFIRFLAQPAPPHRGDHHRWRHEQGFDRECRDFDTGELLFETVGCGACHVRSFVTTSDVDALDQRVVYLYSDLLLHDMGPGLADIAKGVATRAEFRTEPLMGMRARERFLHDGRALSIGSAILQHGGQAEAAVRAFVTLEKRDQKLLVKYLRNL